MNLGSLLDDLQLLFIGTLLDKLKNPADLTSSDLAVIRQFLKDNNVVVPQDLPRPNMDACKDILEDFTSELEGLPPGLREKLNVGPKILGVLPQEPTDEH